MKASFLTIVVLLSSLACVDETGTHHTDITQQDTPDIGFDFTFQDEGGTEDPGIDSVDLTDLTEVSDQEDHDDPEISDSTDVATDLHSDTDQTDEGVSDIAEDEMSVMEECDPVTFLDLVLEEELLLAHDVNGNELLEYSEIADVTRISLANSWHNVSNLTGLECFHSLEKINILGGSITDLEPLRHLVNLRHLTLRRQRVYGFDLEPLFDTSLEALQITGEAGFDGFMNTEQLLQFQDSLRVLQIGGRFTDLNPLARLTRLETLDVIGNYFSDISPIEGLDRLEVLVFRDGASIESLSVLRGENFPELYLLQVEIDAPLPLSEWENISSIRSLHTLEISESGYPEADLQFISDMSQLTGFRCHNNSNVEDISAVSGLDLISIGIKNTSVSDLTPLVGTSIRFLDLRDNQITDLEPLLGLTAEIDDLQIGGNPLTCEDIRTYEHLLPFREEDVIEYCGD